MDDSDLLSEISGCYWVIAGRFAIFFLHTVVVVFILGCSKSLWMIMGHY